MPICQHCRRKFPVAAYGRPRKFCSQKCSAAAKLDGRTSVTRNIVGRRPELVVVAPVESPMASWLDLPLAQRAAHIVAYGSLVLGVG